MPPITPQGSRTALITWTVVTTVLFVTATIFAIYFYVDANRTREEQQTLKRMEALGKKLKPERMGMGEEEGEEMESTTSERRPSRSTRSGSSRSRSRSRRSAA